MAKDRPAPTRRDMARTVLGAAGAAGLAGAFAPAADLKLGLYSITYLGLWYRGPALTLEEVIGRAKKFGYAGVEIDGKRPHGNPLDMPKTRCREIRKYADDHGIELYAVAGNNDLSSPIPEHREAQLVYMHDLIRMTSDLGVKLLRVFAAWPGVTALQGGGGRYDMAKRLWERTHEEFSEEQTWTWCRDSMRELSKYAREAGVTLALQNHPPLIHSYHDVLRMVKEVDSPNLKVCFDARIEHGAKADDIVRATREIGALQVLTHYGNEYEESNGHPVPKEDELAVAQVNGLLDIGYKGYLGFEFCHPVPVVDGHPVGVEHIDKNARLAAQYLRETIAEAKRARAGAA